jgi:hypothetical protein
MNTSTMKLIRLITGASLLCGLLTGCGDGKPASPAVVAGHVHEHKPPHGGALVELGEEEYHVELVLDSVTGKLDAYVLDGELENFVRIGQESFEITARTPGKEDVLVLKAVPNTATGETVGNTAMFEAQADWLKTTHKFDAVLKQLAVNGSAYQNVAFNFPKGNDHDEKDK